MPVGGGRAPPPAPRLACGGREAAASRKEDLLANSEHIAEHQCIARAPERRQSAARACTERRPSPERRQSIARASLGASWDAFGGSALGGGLKRARARAPRNAFGVSWDLLRVSWELLGSLAMLLRDLGRRWASLDTLLGATGSPTDSHRFLPIPTDSHRFPPIPTDSHRFLPIPTASLRFLPIPTDSY